MLIINLKLLLLVLFIGSCLSLSEKKQAKFEKCRPPYSTCNLGKPGHINVHMVPHTHDDVGWLKTVDQYYYGAKNGEQVASVQYILDTVVSELEKDPSKRFVYVEIAFFSRWWNEQTESTKQLVRVLVDEGRLEFVIGAWCMDDEATTYYNDMIDQQALGLRFILKEFGKCARPRSAWQIDPFGHSTEQASLFSQFGFDGLFLGRIDYQDSDYRSKTKTREMLWQASKNLGEEGRIFTGILPNGYGPPPGFCFDIYCEDDPIMDNPNLDDYNVDKKVKDFIDYTLNQAEIYKTSNLIMTMGSDFQFSNAHMWFKNLDKLIYHVNKQQEINGSNINIFYSTTACYLYSLNQANTTWPLKYDDFFPYAHRPHSFWTGYFTSRAALKDYVRRTNNYLQIVRQLSAFADLNDEETQNSINVLERAMAIAQHHDAVSGTERQHVANDYSKRLANGINKCVDVIYKAFNKILIDNFGLVNDSPIYYCSLLNITECLQVENQDRFIVIIYNPLPRAIQSWVRIPAVDNYYQVNDVQTGDLIDSEHSPVYDDTKSIPERKSSANFSLVWRADLPPLGFKLYNVYKDFKVKSQNKKKDHSDYITLKNEYLQLTFDSNGNLIQIDNLEKGLNTPLKQSFCIYKSMPGNNSEPEFQASGAYIFRPKENSCDGLAVRSFKVYQGKQFDEIHQVYNDWISQTIRLYQGAKNAEFESQIGPIDVGDNIGREVVIKFDSSLDSNSLFYTDSNGREMLRRKRNFRPTWNLNQTESIAGNYYPINSRIFIRDEASNLEKQSENPKRQLTIVTDRSQGGASIVDGSIEIMLHRRILFDDSLGVSEPLNEKGEDGNGLIIKGTLNLIFDTVGNSARLHRELAHQINNRPLTIFSTGSLQNKIEKTNKLGEWSAVKSSLPSNLHLLTLMKDYDTADELLNSVVIRIEHFYEKEEDGVLSETVTIDIQNLFNQTFNFMGVEELALGANMRVEDLDEKLKWESDSELDNYLVKMEKLSKLKDKLEINPFEFTFNPMQIRTFRLWFLPK